MHKKLLAISVAASAAAFAQAQTTVTLDSFFDFNYSSTADFDGSSYFNNGVFNDSYNGVGFIEYAFALNGPIDFDQPYIWTLDVVAGGDFEVDGFADSFFFDSGPLVLNDFLNGGAPMSVSDLTYGYFSMSPAQAIATVATFFDNLPNPGTFANIASALGDGSPAAFLSQIEYYHVGSFPEAYIDFALSAPLLDYFNIDSASLSGALNVTLTLSSPIVPVPEPSTYGLIGAGALVVLIGFRRFRARNSAAA